MLELVRKCRDNDDREEWIELFHQSVSLPSVFVRHFQIEQGEVWLVVQQLGDRITAGAGLKHLKTFIFQNAGQHRADRRVIIGYKNSLFHRRRIICFICGESISGGARVLFYRWWLPAESVVLHFKRLGKKIKREETHQRNLARQ